MELPSHAVDNNEFGSYYKTNNGVSHEINIENNQNVLSNVFDKSNLVENMSKYKTKTETKMKKVVE